MALTAELVALCHRSEPDAGLPSYLTEVGDADYEHFAVELLKQREPGPFWLFAYGWHRAFTMHLPRWRGTPEQPGLMMVLEPGGCCVGVAYRLPDTDHHEQMVRLLKRESGSREGLEVARWIHVETPHGKVQALTFWAGIKGPLRVEKQDHARVAEILARACGHAGSGAEYLFHTVSKLEEHGIRDRNLWQLQHLVAEEIIRREANPAVDWGGTASG